MAKRELIVVGGGELGRVIIETAIAAGFSVAGFVDNGSCEETATRTGVPRLGKDDELDSYPDASLVLGIGGLKVSSSRRNVVEAIGVPSDRWATVIHPHSYVSPSAKLAEGVIVLAGAVVSSGVRISRHSIVNIGANIDHDVMIGEFVHVAPQSSIGGGSSIGDDCYLGMGAMIRDHLRVAPRTMVGMGAVVTREFSAGDTLVGVPAKALG